MRRAITAVACAACVTSLLTACASRRRPDPYYVLVAEGLSAPTLTEPMRVIPRGFNIFQRTEACATLRPVARLETPFRTLGFRVGERFPLSALNVVAVNAADIAVRDVPLAIEAEEVSPPVVQLRSNDPDVAQGRLIPVAKGRFRIRVRTICAPQPVETVLTARVDNDTE
ncbi:MAG: hypothetical protein HYU37_12895 [Acidobacteria bacterium]|nr:hypothetical protein [Acidobacteriota bacterium]